MAYTPTTWSDRSVQYPHRYDLTLVSGTTYDFTAVPGTITNAGSYVSATSMNNIETGINNVTNALMNYKRKLRMGLK